MDKTNMFDYEFSPSKPTFQKRDSEGYDQFQVATKSKSGWIEYAGWLPYTRK
jgi:hypothetical protein